MAADHRIVAMLNAHDAVLLALCETHPEPERLLACLQPYFEMHLALTDSDPQIGGSQQAWLDLLHDAIRRNPRMPRTP